VKTLYILLNNNNNDKGTGMSIDVTILRENVIFVFCVKRKNFIQ